MNNLTQDGPITPVVDQLKGPSYPMLLNEIGKLFTRLSNTVDIEPALLELYGPVIWAYLPTPS